MNKLTLILLALTMTSCDLLDDSPCYTDLTYIYEDGSEETVRVEYDCADWHYYEQY